jgi:hypothetical protein
LRDYKKHHSEATTNFTFARSEDQRADLTGDRKGTLIFIRTCIACFFFFFLFLDVHGI